MAYQEKIKQTNEIIVEKELTIKRNIKEKNDSMIELQNCQEELDSVINEKDFKLEEILVQLEDTTGSDYEYITTTSKYEKN